MKAPCLIAVAGLAFAAPAGELEWLGGTPYAGDPPFTHVEGTTTISFSSASVDGLGDFDNRFLFFDLPAMLHTLVGSDVRITGLGWDVDLSTAGGSALGESAALFHAWTGTDHEGLVLTPGFGIDSPGSGSFSSSGIVNFSEHGLPDFTLPGGILAIEFFEHVVDAPGLEEAFWDFEFDLAVDYYPGPAPGSLAVLAFAGMIAARRRR